MKKTLLLSIIAVIILKTSIGQNIIPLDKWLFHQAGNENWYNATVPGTVHTDLLDNKLIPDPFYRTNEDNLQWIDKLNWEYKTSFKLTEDLVGAQRISLVFDGLDTYADVYLNDIKIGSFKNMFRGYEIPLDIKLLKETNELRVYFKSPIFEGLKELETYGFPLPADNDQSEKGGLGPIKVSIFTRKAPYHYGWDWGPRLVTSGIWRKAYIKTYANPVISDLYVQQLSSDVKNATLSAQISFRNSDNSPVDLSIFVNGVPTANKTGLVLTDDSYTSVDFSIKNPLLWWPNGHGKQPLYEIEVKLSKGGEIIATKKSQIGIRQAKLITKPDKKGESFYFEVNGKPIFAKGANIIPNDVFLPRVDSAKYRAIIKNIVDANMNMVRIWGGGVYENDYFYDLCDKYGIMIWHDFMFACAMYPTKEEFYTEVENEAIYNIKRLRNHPCIVLWCGNNEIEQAWGQYEANRGWGWKERYTQTQRDKIWESYDHIFHNVLPDKVKELSPGTAYWHSSPSAGMGKLANHSNTSGDMHYWGVWHGNEPIKSFKKYKARFMSEYGFQSFPEYESVKEYTSAEDWDISSKVMLNHQRSGIGNSRINDYMKQSYNLPNSFEDFLYVSQLLQAEAIKTAIEAHRTDMPYCMGSLYWQLNDCWPVASWSGIDYYGRWKALHYFVREAFKPQIVTVNVENNKINIFGISDTDDATSVSLRVNLMDYYGNSIWNRSVSVNLPVNSSKLLTSISFDQLPIARHLNDALLFVSIVKNEKVIDSDICYFDEPKNLKLPFPEVKVHLRERPGNLYDIEISSKNLCKNLMLISEGNAFEFPDNFFDILPGETKVVTIKTDLKYQEVEKKLSYTHLQEACSDRR